MRNPPPKPYEPFPLYAHRSGQWAKKIKGKTEYFGVWEDPDAAVAKYLADVDYLQAGRTPPSEQKTLDDLLNTFCDHKERLRDSGELSDKAYTDYLAVCKIMAATIGKLRPVETITFDDLGRLRAALSLNKNGSPKSPGSLKRALTVARMVFNFGNEELGHATRYKKALRSPPAKMLREARNEAGERLFEAAEIRALVAKARPNLKAMILLGINCGFGNTDCGKLTIAALDLDGGWHTFARPKTGVARRCPLWPETVEALRAVIKERTTGLVFVTKYGNPWVGQKIGKAQRNPLVLAFRKLMGDDHKEGVTTFYSLRRTFETVATASEVPQSVIDAIMGHVPHAQDMSAVYRQKTYNESLRKCTNFVRGWYLGEIKID